MREAEGLLALAMTLAARQMKQGRYFIFEHPATAKSWATDVVRSVLAKNGVSLATFDQCRYGLVGPSGRPMRKRTTFMTNCAFIHSEFDSKFCTCTQDHQQVIGQELGHQLSEWAAHYPPELCRALARCAQRRRVQRQAEQVRAWG